MPHAPARWTGCLLAAWIVVMPAAQAMAQQYPPLAEPVPLEAQDAQQAVADGEADADADVQGALWFAAGCMLTWIGVLMAYAVEPSPPPARLAGKSSTYARAYADAYRDTALQMQTSAAYIGCLSWGGVILLTAALTATPQSGL